MTQGQMTAQEAMRARHSVRKYEPTMPQEDLTQILELAATAPSAWNLQHWRFLVVTGQENKQRLLPIAYNQQQVVDAPAVIVILADQEADKSADQIYNQAVEAGTIPREIADMILGQIKPAYANNPPQFGHDSALINASFAAMQLMLAATSLGYHTCPMAGFDRDQLVQELNIPSRFYPTMMITLGKGTDEGHASTRLPLGDLVIKERFE
ncbi:nitroreductase family protein [Tumebacillus lipolyticus]|uniref:Nitroreductase family protein n=1 Tax=Tumebacillus lipolyticus TaxID=1280370 RepID=A0ABW4ZVH1_9BACL